MNGRVLIVAGSDSSGGAGIQADIKTIAALGGYPATAITALTAQNTLGVSGVLPTDPEFVARQISSVLDDIGADCIKTGMLVDASVVDVVADTLQALAPDTPLVIDPVIVSTSGAALLDKAGVERLKRRLIARATVVTPNLPEAAMLTGLAVDNLDGMKRAADALLRLGARAVVVKGGHMKGARLVDLVAAPAGRFTIAARRITTRSTHGTGCTYASAVAVSLAQGMTLREAVERAHAYVQAAIRNAPGLGAGKGPLGSGLAAPAAKRKKQGKAHVRRRPLHRRAKSKR